jgi:hypothetical protein
MLKILRTAAALTIAAAGAAGAQDRPSFEVVSIRPATGTPFRGSPVGPGTADPEHHAAPLKNKPPASSGGDRISMHDSVTPSLALPLPDGRGSVRPPDRRPYCRHFHPLGWASGP